jgi:hypothetical protein
MSACNPAGTNYPRFYDAVGAGSWLTVLPQATHVSFQPASLASLLGICGFGRTSSTVSLMLQMLCVRNMQLFSEHAVF